MRRATTIADVRREVAATRAAGGRVGLVPTMGFLHDGHLAHLALLRPRVELLIVSIFVNPTQFGEGEDFTTYPRDLDRDADRLEAAGCDLLFAPAPSEIYPAGFSTYVTVEGITDGYEGAIRPTHFRGVATVVAKLLNIVTPDLVSFGRKDAQQVAVIRRMVRDLDIPTDIELVETVREEDGLAMSSRNVYLDEHEREEARSLSRALRAARQAVARGESVEQAIACMRETVSPEITLDYADVVDPDTFRPARNGNGGGLAIIAGRIGRARLIDNMLLDGEG